MNKQSKKSYLLQKVEYLIEMMEEVHEKDEQEKKKNIFPANYLEVQNIKDILEKQTSLPKESLIKLNRYYREVAARKDLLENEHRSMSYEEYIEWKVKDILEDDSDENRYKSATYFVVEYAVKKSGHPFNLEESVEFVEQIRSKYGIKRIKDDTNKQDKRTHPVQA